MDNMRAKLSSTTELGGEAVALADDFTYVDPVPAKRDRDSLRQSQQSKTTQFSGYSTRVFRFRIFSENFAKFQQISSYSISAEIWQP